MAKNRHIIKKQLLEVEIDDSSAAGEAQAQFAAIFRRQLLPILNRTLDELSPANVLHRIDRLEIDLGEVELSQFDPRLPAKFQALLKAELAGQLAKIQAANGQPPQAGPSSGASTAADPPEKGQPPIPIDSARELWVHFMQNGQLPWWADASQPDILPTSLEELIVQDPQWLKGFLRKNLTLEPFQQRLFTSLSSYLLAELALVLIAGPSQKKAIRRFIQGWLAQLPEISRALSVSPAKMQYESWQLFFSILVLGRGLAPLSAKDQTPAARHGAFSEETLLKQLAIHLAHRGPVSQQDIIAVFQASPMGKTLSSNWADDLPLPGKKRTASAPSGPKGRQIPADTEDIYIQNAGLVILWAYLARFFSHLGFIEEKEFVHFDAQCQAAGLLQYIVDGTDEAPEFLLPLNKILCGIPISHPLEPQDPLTETEKALAEALLTALISHAPVLGEVSNDGFRNTFLKREGILKYQGDYWLLQVKRETHDILLDRLPWSFKHIKSPWMATSIYVEW